MSRRDIAEELQKAGFNITADDVKLDEPLRRVDTYTVHVALAADLKADIKLWIVREKVRGGPGRRGRRRGRTAGEAPAAEAGPAEAAARGRHACRGSPAGLTRASPIADHENAARNQGGVFPFFVDPLGINCHQKLIRHKGDKGRPSR